MAKKLTALLMTLALLCMCAGALGEINLTRKDLQQAEGLDKSVTHIVFLLQDGDVTDTIMLASINSKTGRSVMTQISCAREVEVAMGDGSAATMPLGEVYAQNMGVPLRSFRAALILLSSVLSACVTAFAGPISFVGIAVPHLMKSLFKSAEPLIMIPASFLGGGVFCLLCDLIARTAFAPTEVSISSVTAVFGAPVVIYMMIHRKAG